RWPHEHADRGCPDRLRGHGEVARQARVPQAPRLQSRPSGRAVRARDRARAAEGDEHVTAAAAHRDRPPPARRLERQLLARVEELLRDARAELGVELPAPAAAGPGGPLARAGRLLEHVTWAALRQLERFD